MSVLHYAVHRDENLYSDSENFGGIRFVEKDGVKAQGDALLRLGMVDMHGE